MLRFVIPAVLLLGLVLTAFSAFTVGEGEQVVN